MVGTPRRVVATIVASALSLVSVTAGAQPTPTAAQKQQAGDLTKQAIAKSQASEHQAAIDLYLEAYALVPLAVLLSNVGAEHQKLKQPVLALKYFCMYLEKDPKGQSWTFATAQAVTLQLELGNQDATEAEPCKAPVVVVTPPPPDPVVAPPVQPAPTETTSGGGLRLVGLGAAGAGVIALGVGVVFGMKAKTVSDQISDHPMDEQWPADIRDLEAKGQAHEDKQVLFMIAGGALLATGTVLYLVGGPKQRSAEQVTIMPTLSPDGAGFAARGSF
ncbi:MAG: hypothetical protein H0X17_11385 [Deltaproteobacteria bacterium]|nr:hypothetical protein [Deltaproteobacteria bacterium]